MLVDHSPCCSQQHHVHMLWFCLRRVQNTNSAQTPVFHASTLWDGNGAHVLQPCTNGHFVCLSNLSTRILLPPVLVGHDAIHAAAL